MADTAETRQRNGIASEDWQGVQLGPRISANNDYSTVHEEGLSTGVRVRGMHSFPRIISHGCLTHNNEQRMGDWISSFESKDPGSQH